MRQIGPQHETTPLHTCTAQVSSMHKGTNRVCVCVRTGNKAILPAHTDVHRPLGRLFPSKGASLRTPLRLFGISSDVRGVWVHLCPLAPKFHVGWRMLASGYLLFDPPIERN